MRKLWTALPGPPVVRLVELLVILVVALVALFFLFEWAGQFLDSGGAVGI